MGEEDGQNDNVTASPDSEWEASGIGRWGDERKEGDVGGEVT